MSLRLTLISSVTPRAERFVLFPSDEPLGKSGEEQVRMGAVGFRLARIVHTSPALRAKQTAGILGFDIVVEPALRDCDHGRWTGRSLEEVQAEEPEAVRTWMSDPYSAPHGGESLVAVVQRVAAWLDARTETGRLVAVTHPAIVRAASLHALGVSIEAFRRIDVEPFHRTELSHDGRRWVLRSLNAALS